MAEPKQIFNSLRGFFSKLSPRERVIVLAGGVAFILFVIFISVSLSPGKKEGKKPKTDQLVEQRAEFFKTAEQYANLKPIIELIDGRIATRPPDFDLYRRVNELIESLGMRPMVVKMDPGQVPGKEFLDEEYVDLNIQKIDLRLLITFLDQVEQLPGLVKIGQLTIKTRMDQSKTLDVVARISAYKEKGAQ